MLCALFICSANLFAQNTATIAPNCGAGILTVTGNFNTSNNNRLNILLFKDGSIINSATDIVAPSYSQSFPINGSGSYYAKVREVNNDANEVNSSAVAIDCSGGTNPPTNPNPPSNPGSNNASLAVNCSTSQLNISGNLTTSNGNKINILIFKDNSVVSSVTDIPGPSYSVAVALSGNGSYYALVREVNNDGNNVTSSTLTVNCSSNPNPPTNPPSNPNYTGNLESVNCSEIHGWVADLNNPNQSLKFDLYLNGWLAATNVDASISRSDVADNLDVSNYDQYGFGISLPPSFKVGVPLTISVKYAGTLIDIPGSPKTTATCVQGPTTSTICGIESIFPGSTSTLARNGAVSRNNSISLQLSHNGAGSVSSLTSQLFPVKKGDQFSLEAYAMTSVPSRRNLAPQIVTAAVGGVLAGVALTQQQTSLTDQRHTTQVGSSLGLSTVLMIPLIKSLSARQLPNATMELAFYNKQGRFIQRQQININRDAIGGWQLLHINGHAPQDGYAVIRLQNKSKRPVHFSELSFQDASTKAVGNDSKVLFSHNGFKPQLAINESLIYKVNSDCDDGPGLNYSTGQPFTFGGVNYIDVGATVKAPAPVYEYVGGTLTIRSSDIGPADTPSSGGNSYTRTSRDEALKKMAKSTSIRMRICAGFNSIWNWSYSNNDIANTVEIFGFQLADGTFVSIPWQGNDAENFTFTTNTYYPDNTGVWSYALVRSQTGTGWALKAYNNLYPNTKSYEIGVDYYVHTHPFDYTSNPNVYTPSATSNGKDDNGDWNLAAQTGIPGKIITQDKIVNFHWDPNGTDKASKQKTDAQEPRVKDCSQQN